MDSPTNIHTYYTHTSVPVCLGQACRHCAKFRRPPRPPPWSSLRAARLRRCAFHPQQRQRQGQRLLALAAPLSCGALMESCGLRGGG